MQTVIGIILSSLATCGWWYLSSQPSPHSGGTTAVGVITFLFTICTLAILVKNIITGWGD